MNRIKVIQETKFNRLSKEELRSTKGGFCLSCRKRDRKVELGFSVSVTYEDWELKVQ